MRGKYQIGALIIDKCNIHIQKELFLLIMAPGAMSSFWKDEIIKI